MRRLEKQFFVYLLASGKNGTLYVGVTSDLPKRVWQHKNKLAEGFTHRHGVDKLVWCEACPDARSAVLREKQLKKWNRDWKIRLIETDNPQWLDLAETLLSTEEQQIPGFPPARE